MGETRTKGGPVAQVNTASLALQGKPPTPKTRSIVWTLKSDWMVGEEITKAAIGLTVSEGTDTAKLTAPSPAKLAAPGTVTVTATADADGDYAAVTRSQQVTVKHRTSIAWSDPLPVMKNTDLGPKQLDAKPTPKTLTLVYAPPAGTKLTKAGTETLTASFAGDADHLPATPVSVKILVLDDAKDLASKTGEIAMASGRGWKAGLHAKAQEALDTWNASDPTDTKTARGQAAKIMTDVKDKTAKAMATYLDSLIIDKAKDKWTGDTEEVEKNINGVLTKVTAPKKAFNVIWKLDNGLQIRLKPNGDGRTGPDGSKPRFCVELRRSDITDFAEDPSQTAAKVTADGVAAPPGPGEMEIPGFENRKPGDPVDPVKDDLRGEAKNSACEMTHLFCKPKPRKAQTITWATPVTLKAGDPLTATHLNATGLGNPPIRYVFTEPRRLLNNPLWPGTKLAEGTYKAYAEAYGTLTHDGGQSAEVTITGTAP